MESMKRKVKPIAILTLDTGDHIELIVRYELACEIKEARYKIVCREFGHVKVEEVGHESCNSRVKNT